MQPEKQHLASYIRNFNECNNRHNMHFGYQKGPKQLDMQLLNSPMRHQTHDSQPLSIVLHQDTLMNLKCLRIQQLTS